MIGDGPTRIEVVILESRKDHVRIGITAPRDVPVHREEVYNRIHNETVPLKT